MQECNLHVTFTFWISFLVIIKIKKKKKWIYYPFRVRQFSDFSIASFLPWVLQLGRIWAVGNQSKSVLVGFQDSRLGFRGFLHQKSTYFWEECKILRWDSKWSKPNRTIRLSWFWLPCAMIWDWWSWSQCYAPFKPVWYQTNFVSGFDIWLSLVNQKDINKASF